MKKFILALLLILFSSNAYSMSVKNLYEYCKPYQSSGFKKNNNRDAICLGYVSGMVHAGGENCSFIMGEVQSLRILDDPRLDPQIRRLNRFAQQNANEYLEDNNVAVNLFINWVEKNMSTISDIWHINSAVSHRWKFIGIPFKCDLDKYNK